MNPNGNDSIIVVDEWAEINEWLDKDKTKDYIQRMANHWVMPFYEAREMLRNFVIQETVKQATELAWEELLFANNIGNNNCESISNEQTNREKLIFAGTGILELF